MLSLHQCLVLNGDSEKSIVPTAIGCKLDTLNIIGGHVPVGLGTDIKEA